MEKAEKEAQEARKAVKTQQQAVDQAQNELNLVQASQEEKQKNYDYAFAKVKALGGNTSATAESAATHQTQAEAALAQAKAEKIAAENEVNQKTDTFKSGTGGIRCGRRKCQGKRECTGKAENALKQLEAETNSSIVKKRADVDEKQNALDIAEKELEERKMCPYLMPWNRKTKQNRHWKNRRQNCLCYRESWQHRQKMLQQRR